MEKMTFSIKQYIKETVTKKAKIKYDRSVQQWVGILDHPVGFICAQKNSKKAITKELATALEEFIVLDLARKNEAKATKIPRAHQSA